MMTDGVGTSLGDLEWYPRAHHLPLASPLEEDERC